jgi:hypothetical protein
VFTLRPSLISGAGIGCFLESPIVSGDWLFPEHKEQFRLLESVEIPEPYLKYCMLRPDGRYTCPESFLRMSVCWYINHSRTPNCQFVKGKLCAIVDITSDTEVTLYYRDLLSHPKNRQWCTPHDINWTQHGNASLSIKTTQAQYCV